MKQEEEKAIGVPENCVPRAKAGRSLQPLDESRQEISRSKPVVGTVGYRHGGSVFGGGSLSGTESGTSIRGGHPHRHYRRRRVRRSQT